MSGTPFDQLLRANNLRVTAIRLAVLDVLERQAHVPAEVVLDQVRTRLGSASVQAVYDALHALTGAGIIHSIEPAGHPARYELRVGDNHHHMICRTCGRIEDVDCSVGHAPCLIPSSQHGFRIATAEVTYWGYCEACQASEAH